MDFQIDEKIKELTIEYFMESKIGTELQRGFDDIEKYQAALYNLYQNEDGTVNTMLRVGTILSLSIVKKIARGADIKNLKAEDWKDIADDVAQYALVEDGQSYTVFVFLLYADYIDLSLEIRKDEISDDSAEDISHLSERIKSLTSQLQSGDITEPDYVDQCLWLSFEAMIKILAAYRTNNLSPEFALLIQSIADFAVQYGRYCLYSKEDALLTEYLEHQQVLDEELSAKFEQYVEELNTQAEKFNELLDSAFSDDFESRLKGSVMLAREVGVPEEEILGSVEEIDDFFT